MLDFSEYNFAFLLLFSKSTRVHLVGYILWVGSMYIYIYLSLIIPLYTYIQWVTSYGLAVCIYIFISLSSYHYTHTFLLTLCMLCLRLL